MKERTLSDKEQSTLSNALFVASERFQENAKTLRTEAARGDITEGARHHYNQLAEIFDGQVAETRALIALIDDADAVRLI
jgi:hypothetical protein